MVKKFTATALAATAALALGPVLAASPASADARAATADAGTTVDREVTCSASGAVGTARISIDRVGSPSSGWEHRVTVKQYKIDYSGGGNSANVNLGLVGDWGSGPGGTTTWWNSRDEMYQDGQWHSNLTLAGPLVGSIPGPVGREITTTVEFVFDRSGGGDPRCTTSVTTIH